ncbi:MAG: hypothetical protein Q7J78_00200, partial [Clostridiales bacterium]|nr:hypothetical protein [Clostridiales bacterium]
VLPYYEKYVPLLKERGKITTVHAHASTMKVYTDTVLKMGVDVVEAFTPPPVGNLSLIEARHAWGEDKVICINFPETIFHEGYEKTLEFTIDLLKSDPNPRKMILFTEMGMMGVNKENRNMFKEGFKAVADAIDEVEY